jgi:hypothetical protein
MSSTAVPDMRFPLLPLTRDAGHDDSPFSRCSPLKQKYSIPVLDGQTLLKCRPVRMQIKIFSTHCPPAPINLSPTTMASTIVCPSSSLLESPKNRVLTPPTVYGRAALAVALSPILVEPVSSPALAFSIDFWYSFMLNGTGSHCVCNGGTTRPVEGESGPGEGVARHREIVACAPSLSPKT